MYGYGISNIINSLAINFDSSEEATSIIGFNISLVTWAVGNAASWESNACKDTANNPWLSSAVWLMNHSFLVDNDNCWCWLGRCWWWSHWLLVAHRLHSWLHHWLHTWLHHWLLVSHWLHAWLHHWLLIAHWLHAWLHTHCVCCCGGCGCLHLFKT